MWKSNVNHSHKLTNQQKHVKGRLTWSWSLTLRVLTIRSWWTFRRWRWRRRRCWNKNHFEDSSRDCLQDNRLVFRQFFYVLKLMKWFFGFRTSITQHGPPTSQFLKSQCNDLLSLKWSIHFSVPYYIFDHRDHVTKVFNLAHVVSSNFVEWQSTNSLSTKNFISKMSLYILCYSYAFIIETFFVNLTDIPETDYYCNVSWKMPKSVDSKILLRTDMCLRLYY